MIEMIKIGDVVNVHAFTAGYWKGRVIKIYTGHPYTNPIAIIDEIGGPGHAALCVKNLVLKDGEYYTTTKAGP